jgi:hypothetical protein
MLVAPELRPAARMTARADVFAGAVQRALAICIAAHSISYGLSGIAGDRAVAETAECVGMMIRVAGGIVTSEL